MNRTTHACVRIITLPPATPDYRTALADRRIALGAARGIDLDDLDPGLGWDLSDRAYRTVRDRWAGLAAEADPFARDGYNRVRAYWRERRPDLAHDWPEWGGEDA